ncbi:hypothetical protein BJ742DRAFT_479704 [Cladochytrium replicatum]|nr:hypothetical protein BJ742DRAFT_479704 [Cladochytrium replicatum]
MSRISEQQPKSSPEEVAWQILSPSISTLSSPSSEVQTLLRRLTASVDEQKRALVPVPTPPPLLPPRDEGSPIVTSSPLIPPASPAEAVDPAREAFAAYIEDMKANEGQKFNMLNELNSMGFTLEHADAALEMTRGNMEQAVSVLLEQPARVTQHSSQKLQNIIARRRQQQQQQQNNPLALLSQTINRSSSTLFKELAGIVREASENVGGGSPQAPVVSPRTSTQSTPTQSPGVTRRPRPPSMFNPLRKVSSILGKALGMEDMNDVDDYPNSPSRRGPSLEDAELSETFMMQFGTQVRTMYNLRMAVLNNGMGDVFRPIIVKAKRDGQEHDGEDAEVADMMARTIAYRAQTASALYSKDLTGAVVLLSSKDFARYGSSRSVNNELIGNCVRSTELHFTDIRKQFEQVRNKLPKDEHGEPILNEGDFFVTRHSNLPLVHVVFHLIYSDESSKELTNRSALLTGYRSVLRLAHHCGVNNLTIPIILLPDDTAFSIDSNANPATVLYRRAELVLKSTKAMITEFSRAVKHGRDSSGVDADAKTFQFVLSQRYSVMMGRPTTQGTADAVVEGFGAVRGALVDVFRAS